MSQHISAVQKTQIITLQIHIHIHVHVHVHVHVFHAHCTVCMSNHVQSALQTTEEKDNREKKDMNMNMYIYIHAAVHVGKVGSCRTEIGWC